MTTERSLGQSRLHSRPEAMIRRAISGARFAGSQNVRVQAAWQQAAWFVDPQNVSGVASDNNDGKTALRPVRTFDAGVLGRWGTYAPRLRQNTSVVFLSSHTDGTDPVIANPYMENGALFSILGSTPTPVATGILAGVLAKNRATPQQLTADLGASGAVGQLLVNTTRSAVCWVDSLVAGTTFVLTQPMTVPVPGSGVLPTEVDTFANGDAFRLIQPLQINIEEVGGLVSDLNPTTFANRITLANLTMMIPAGAGFKNVSFGATTQLEVVSAASNLVRPVFTATGSFFDNMINCRLPAGLIQKAGASAGGVAPFRILGGSIQSTMALDAALLDGDVYVACGTSAMIAGGGVGAVCVPAGNTLKFIGDIDAQGNLNVFGTVKLWGAGTYNVQGRSKLAIPGGAGSAAALWPSAGTVLAINGISQAHSVIGGAPDVTNLVGALTPANIDAAAGVAGYGGEPFSYVGASMSKSQT